MTRASLDPERCYRALSARDARFDGVFFVGVTTTRIYCRPVCPARLPRPDRCTFFPSAPAAERAGFRPCLRCRPELAPGRAMVDATGRLANAAAARIAAGALNDGSVDALAAELHASPRQLRRALKQELGVTPVELAQTHRLLLAKRLLADSELSMTEVAFASGFASVSRFNALVRARYRLSPSALRRVRASGSAPGTLTLTLAYRLPLAWDAMLAFLAARATPGVEVVAGGRYLRTISLGNHRGHIAVGPAGDGVPALRVELALSLAPALMPLLARLKALFDLDAEPERIKAHLAADPRLRERVHQQPGLRVPGSVDGFELALRAVLGQQVSVRTATTLAGRIAHAFGEPAETGDPALTRLAASAERLAEAQPSTIAALGLTRARAECVVALARASADGGLRLEPGAEVDATLECLRALPGIGEWTAQYVAMRALRWPDAFPHADLGLRKALGGVSPKQLLEAAERWRPWRAYAAMHLWNHLGSAQRAEPTGTTGGTHERNRVLRRAG